MEDKKDIMADQFENSDTIEDVYPGYDIPTIVDMTGGVNPSPVSFSQLESEVVDDNHENDVMKLASIANELIHNVFSSEIPDKKAAVMLVLQEYSDRVNAVLSGDTGKMSILLRTKEMIKKLFGKKSVETTKTDNKESTDDKKSFFLWKETDGTYRWFTIYSNNFIDEDKEIISKDSHKAYQVLVESGTVKYPILMHWHTKDTEWGQADMIGFDETTGCAYASGYVLKGHEQEAENLYNMSEVMSIAVSHGMLAYRDENDRRVISSHITKEISDLPLWAAANKLTEFIVLKEESNMPLPDEKKKYLKQVGLSDEKIASIENDMESKSSKASDMGLETKESVAELPVEEVTPVETPVEDVKEDVNSQLLKQIALAVEAMSNAIQTVSARVDSLEKEKQEDVDMTPMASIMAMATSKMRVVGSGKSTLKESDGLKFPEESKESKNTPVVFTGNSVLDNVLTNVVKGK